MKRKLQSKIIHSILNDIESTITILRGEYLIRDEQGCSLKEFGRNSYNITYNGKSTTNNIMYDKNISLTEMMDILLKERQYTILMYDKGIVQCEFMIENDIITKERLVFLKKHSKLWSQEEINQAENEDRDWFSDEMGIPISLRIDYSPKDRRECHPATHFTISNSSACRIPMKSLVMFSEFIRFITFHFYDVRLKMPKCNLERDVTLTELERQMMHINWQ